MEEFKNENKQIAKTSKAREWLNKPFIALLKLTLFKIALNVFAVAVILKMLSMFVFPGVPLQSDLFSVHGKIQNIHIGGNGKATWLEIQSNRSIKKYYSFFGRVWPGMDTLKKGDVVDIIAWDDGVRRANYYIWQLAKGSEIIVKPENVQALKEESISDIDTFSDRFLFISALVLCIAFMRHLKIRSKQL